MALNKTLRPGLIQMRVLDLDQTLDFYTNILGLNEVGRTALSVDMNIKFLILFFIARVAIFSVASILFFIASSGYASIKGKCL